VGVWRSFGGLVLPQRFDAGELGSGQCEPLTVGVDWPAELQRFDAGFVGAGKPLVIARSAPVEPWMRHRMKMKTEGRRRADRMLTSVSNRGQHHYGFDGCHRWSDRRARPATG